jgi:hypothetical protein
MPVGFDDPGRVHHFGPLSVPDRRRAEQSRIAA